MSTHANFPCVFWIQIKQRHDFGESLFTKQTWYTQKNNKQYKRNQTIKLIARTKNTGSLLQIYIPLLTYTGGEKVRNSDSIFGPRCPYVELQEYDNLRLRVHYAETYRNICTK